MRIGVNFYTSLSSDFLKTHLPDVPDNAHSGTKGPSHSLTVNGHTWWSRDGRGKLPKVVSVPHLVMTKCTPAVKPTSLTVNRLCPSGHTIIHHRLIRIELNNMFDSISIVLNQIHEYTCQYDNTESRVILGHNWLRYLQLLERLGVDPDLWPVKEILLDCAHSHYKNKMEQSIDNIRSLIEETCHKINTTIITVESMTANYRYIQRREKRPGSQRKTDPSIHTKQSCIRPNCFSYAKENMLNLTGKPLSRQITLLSNSLSFIPRTEESTP